MLLRLALAMGGRVTRMDLDRILSTLSARLSRKFGSVDNYKLEERSYIKPINKGGLRTTDKGVKKFRTTLSALSNVEEVVFSFVLESVK